MVYWGHCDTRFSGGGAMQEGPGGVSCIGSSVSWVYDIGNSVVLGGKNFRESTVATVALRVLHSTSRSSSEKLGQVVLGSRTCDMHVSGFRARLQVHMRC